jgi:hypothetical protein
MRAHHDKNQPSQSAFEFSSMENKVLHDDPRKKGESNTNYDAYHPEASIGFVELCGKRSSQEDCVRAGVIVGNHWGQLSKTDYELALNKTMDLLQHVLTPLYEGCSGSTLCTRQDNVSVAMTMVDDKSKGIKHMAASDGYRGDEVSKALFQLFDVILKVKLQCALLAKKTNIVPSLSLGAIDLACHDIINVFDAFTRGNKQDDWCPSSQKIVNMKVCYEKMAMFLDQILSLLENEHGDYSKLELKRAIHSTHTFTKLLLSIKSLEKMRENHCPEVNELFLTYPFGLCKDFIEKIKSIDADNLKEIKNEFQQLCDNLEPLYRAARYIFDVRKDYDRKMPSSFDIEFITYQDAQAKPLIQHIEQAVKNAFLAYPDQTVTNLVAGLMNDLTYNDRALACSRANSVMNFFLQTNRLSDCLHQASIKVEALHKSVKEEDDDSLNYII